MKTVYTTIDIIPSHIPRQLAIELLQSHGELITLNPLVLDYRAIKAPRDAPNDEFYSTWYEITQRIQFMPGIGKMGSSKVSFRGCFHDMPWGVQTHMYVPMGIELRHKYQIKGNQPGEPPEPKELGSNAPSEGLYLRVDTQIKANVTMVSFVKKELKAASKTMLERMIKKAELIDAGVLQAMFDDTGKLKTSNPNDRSRAYEPSSPAPFTPSAYGPNGVNLRAPSQGDPRQSAYHRQSNYTQHNNTYNHSQQSSQAIEMPGDTQYGQSSSYLHPNSSRFSNYSEMSGSSPQPHNGRWSGVHSEGQSSQDGSMSSYPTTYSAPPNSMGSPRHEFEGGKSFAAELPGNEVLPPRPPKVSPVPNNQDDDRQFQQSQHGYAYNPQHYAGMGNTR